MSHCQGITERVSCDEMKPRAEGFVDFRFLHSVCPRRHVSEKEDFQRPSGLRSPNFIALHDFDDFILQLSIASFGPRGSERGFLTSVSFAVVSG